MAQVVREALVEYLTEEPLEAGEVLASAAKPVAKEPMILREEDLTPEELEELRKNPQYHLIGLYSSDKPDAGIHHDDYLHVAVTPSLLPGVNRLFTLTKALQGFGTRCNAPPNRTCTAALAHSRQSDTLWPPA